MVEEGINPIDQKGEIMKIFKTLPLLLIPVLFVPSAWATEKVRIITGDERPTECISSVQINNIDGREVRVPPLEIQVEPGKRTLRGRAIINTDFCPAVGIRNTNLDIKPLEADFEIGKVYYVGYDHSSSDRNDWGLVIWQVDED